MKEYLKLAVVALVAGVVAGLVVGWLVSNQSDLLGGGTRLTNGLSTDSTAPSAGQVRTTTLTVTGTSTITGSPDGFMAGGTLTVSTTTGVQTLYTHTGTPAICDSNTGGLYAKGNSPFAPGLTVGIGTTTTSGGLVNNLVATSTNVANVATSTAGSDAIVRGSPSSIFLLNPTDKIRGIVDDSQATAASSTYFGRWSLEYQLRCWSASI